MVKKIQKTTGILEGLGNFDSDTIGLFMEISTDDITKSPYNKFAIEKIEELAKDITEYGQIHNALVRPIGEKYELISGERRWNACKLLGRKLECKVVEVDDLTAKEMVIVANLSTRHIDDILLAENIKELEKLVKEHKESGKFAGQKTRKIVSDMLSTKKKNISVTMVGQIKALDKLIPEMKALVKAGDIPREKAYQISLMTEENQNLFINVHNELTAKEIEALKKKQNIGQEIKKDLDLLIVAKNNADTEINNLTEKVKTTEAEKNKLLDKVKKTESTIDKAVKRALKIKTNEALSELNDMKTDLMKTKDLLVKKERQLEELQDKKKNKSKLDLLNLSIENTISVLDGIENKFSTLKKDRKVDVKDIEKNIEALKLKVLSLTTVFDGWKKE